MLSIDAFADDAKIVMNPTSETEIITAAAVVAVRRGLRAAFSRARLPAMPLIAVKGRPIASASPRANNGLRTNTPSSTTNAPAPTAMSPLLPYKPRNRSVTPAAVTRVPMITRRTRCTGRSSATSRIAAIGGMRAACRAGTTADKMVTTVPTIMPMITALGRTTTPLPGISSPIALIAALMPTDERDAGHDADRRRDQADDDRLPDHRREHLRPAGADRAQERHLAQPLRHHDRKRVVDDERRRRSGR